MSSSRVQTTFTGPSTSFAMRTALVSKSTSSRRPNPPPSRWLWTTTFSGGKPVTWGAVALLPGDHAGLLRGRVELSDDISRAHLGIRTFVPADDERGQPLLRRPHVVGDHGDQVIEAHDLAHTRDRLGQASVQAGDLAP